MAGLQDTYKIIVNWAEIKFCYMWLIQNFFTLEGESEEEEHSGDEKEESEDDEDQGVMSENKYAYTSEPQG